MIRPETIQRIVDTARIEEVVGDFVTLKKRGVNYIGHCPFHNEKTPSFNVNPVRNIYKCFGCGKGGDSVGFVMEHEKSSYPEALKYLAKKYSIEVEESVYEPKDTEAEHRRESLLIVSDFAKKFFVHTLWESEEGQSIGLSYFKERGFREETLKTFELGYSPEEWEVLTQKATAEGYQTEYLEATGLSVRNDNGRVYDRFRGRVMFPVHNMSGRVIAFTGRTLKKDPKVPKYVNSPESDIYHKGNVLYGLYQAKKAINVADMCYLVEGNTDVISLHQAGIENVVASMGTALTAEQIRLIQRFSKNVTILYDGDPAGIKASLRGIDLLLEEGLNVRVVLFPDGTDPDEYVKSLGGTAFKEYISKQSKPFIEFKTDILLQGDNANDPIERAKLYEQLAESISRIQQPEQRSEFIRLVAHRFEMDERVFIGTVNKLLRKKADKKFQTESGSESGENRTAESNAPAASDIQKELEERIRVGRDEYQEREIIRLLLLYGEQEISLPMLQEKQDKKTGKTIDEKLGDETLLVADYLLRETEDVSFNHTAYLDILAHYKAERAIGALPTAQQFVQHTNKALAAVAVELLAERHELSQNWKSMHQIEVVEERTIIALAAQNAQYHLKLRKIMQLIRQNQELLKQESTEEGVTLRQRMHIDLTKMRQLIARRLGIVVSS